MVKNQYPGVEVKKHFKSKDFLPLINGLLAVVNTDIKPKTWYTWCSEGSTYIYDSTIWVAYHPDFLYFFTVGVTTICVVSTIISCLTLVGDNGGIIQICNNFWNGGGFGFDGNIRGSNVYDFSTSFNHFLLGIEGYPVMTQDQLKLLIQSVDLQVANNFIVISPNLKVLQLVDYMPLVLNHPMGPANAEHVSTLLSLTGAIAVIVRTV